MSNTVLIAKAKTGNKEAVLQLYRQNHRLIYKCVSSYECNRYPIEDLMQEAYFAMVKAVEAYEPDSGHVFTTYLVNALKWHFARYVRGDKSRHDYCTLDAPVNSSEEDGTTKGELIEDDAAAFEDDVLNRVTTEKVFGVVKKVLSETNEPCFNVLYWRYGNNVSRAKIAETLGCSLQDVKKIEKKALRILYREKAMLSVRSDIIDASCHHSTLKEFKHTRTSSVEWAVERMGD